MHIPDGFISPKVYIPAYIILLSLIGLGIKKIKNYFKEDVIPYLSALTALSFIVMMIQIPLPGGTTGHAIGIAIIAILFQPYIAFFSISLVILIQAILFGSGGITSFPVNAISMAFVGSLVSFYTFILFSKFNEKLALFLAGFFSIIVSAFIISIILGIQPIISHDSSGKPLFFPFDIYVTIPAIMIPHLFVGIGEGIFTVVVYTFIKKITQGKEVFER